MNSTYSFTVKAGVTSTVNIPTYLQNGTAITTTLLDSTSLPTTVANNNIVIIIDASVATNTKDGLRFYVRVAGVVITKGVIYITHDHVDVVQQPNFVLHNAQKVVSLERDFGGVGDGTTDNAAAFDAAFAVANVVTIGEGIFAVSRPVTFRKDRQTLEGLAAHRWPYNTSAVTGEVNQIGPSTIIPMSGFVGDSVIAGLDPTVNNNTPTNNCVVRNIGIGGFSRKNSAAGPIHGIELHGAVTAWKLDNVTISQVSGHGVYTHQGVYSAAPRGVRMTEVVVWSAGLSTDTDKSGFFLSGMSDGMMDSCLAVSCSGPGFYLLNVGQYGISNCLSVFNLGEGYSINGITTGNVNGTGNPGMGLTACYSDRNGKDGLLITLTGPRAQVTVVGGDFHRDGANNETGGGGYAAIALRGAVGSPVCPVHLVGVRTSVDANDAHNSVWAPQIGVFADRYEKLGIDGCYIWGFTSSLAQTNAINSDSMRIGDTTTTYVGNPGAKVNSFPDITRGQERVVSMYQGSSPWTVPAADQEIFNSNTRRLYYDLSTMHYAQISLGANIGGATAQVAIQYSIDSGTTWTNLTSNVPLTSGYQTSTWTAIGSAARTRVLLRTVGRSGDGTAQANVQGVNLHVRP